MRWIYEIDIEGLPEPFVVLSDPNEEDLIDPRKRALLMAWRKPRFALSRIPRLDELDADLLKELFPNLMELAVLPDGDFLYKSYGSSIAAAYGRDMTGRKTSEFPTPIAKAFVSVYGLALKRPQPYATRHKPPTPMTDGHWHRLILPLAGDAGGVCGFIVCNVPIDR
jgi:hypothetical protein